MKYNELNQKYIDIENEYYNINKKFNELLE